MINSKCKIYDNRPEACRNFTFVIFRMQKQNLV
ncbi:hypothetical protein [Methanosarcina sp.]